MHESAEKGMEWGVKVSIFVDEILAMIAGT